MDSFYGAIKTLCDSLVGEATFDAMEEQLHLRLRGDGRGHISAEGVARDRAGTGNELRFCAGTRPNAFIQHDGSTQ